ncbi:XRE family transcriptional regulator [Acinetobacter sp. ANC 3813]|uniref:XRE family transcriptional regulator n=1 Tax=Acinetobacter sp. ANC 3813 TaxID=1977873 RepID=UPI000A33ADCE|nr:XRE family transcriptional regulator [Acinetobacter sp. ANC 3813]OTG87852.1 hypothetical protein B9T34_16075 [Acinetobacter sp. ANC 3813]
MNSARTAAQDHEGNTLLDDLGETESPEKLSHEITYAKKGYGVQTTPRPLGAVRLEMAMSSAGINQTELALLAGVTQTTISRIINGETINSKHLPKIALALNKGVDWLSGANTAETSAATITGNKLIIDKNLFILVPRYKGYKDGEDGHIIGRDIETDDTRMLLSSSIPETIDKDSLNFYIESERAMHPIITIGATVYFENNWVAIASGDIYAVRIGSQITARNLFTQPNGDILMRAKESDFPDFTIPNIEAKKYVLGRIIFVTNKLS